jgi:hypothetical protein
LFLSLCPCVFLYSFLCHFSLSHYKFFLSSFLSNITFFCLPSFLSLSWLLIGNTLCCINCWIYEASRTLGQMARTLTITPRRRLCTYFVSSHFLNSCNVGGGLHFYTNSASSVPTVRSV